MAAVLRSMGERDKAREELKLFEQKKQESRQETVAENESRPSQSYLQAGDARRAVELYLEAIARIPKTRARNMTSLGSDRLGDYRGERDAC